MLQGQQRPHNGIEGHTIYSGHSRKMSSGRKAHIKQNSFLFNWMNNQVKRVKSMKAPEFDIKNYIELRKQQTGDFCEPFDVEIDPTAAEVLDTIHSTPLGRLLRMIGSLPEIRQEKVCDVRRQIDFGQYDINENLDVALDRVLEEFIADG